MNARVALLAFAACLAALILVELRSRQAARADAPIPVAVSAPPAPQQTLDLDPVAITSTLLARPLFSQARHPPTGAGAVASAPSAATPLPRMTGILIDGPRRSAIFASAGSTPGGKPTIVAEGGHIGPFIVQTIEPQQVIVLGPEGRRTVRTSFDPTLQPPPAPQPLGLGAPQFPGIAALGGLPLILPPKAPSAGYGLPQSAGAAR